MLETGVVPPHGPWKRGLQDANFSLEVNTEDVPSDGRYYVLRGGEVVLATAEFPEALAEYNRLCRDFWLSRLEDPQPKIRIAAAWGLLSLDSSDRNAIAVITRDGSPQERKRLEQSQSRRRALRSRA